MTGDRATWERAAEKVLEGCGFAELTGNMPARLDAMFPLCERFISTSAERPERCLMLLFMACVEDDEER